MRKILGSLAEYNAKAIYPELAEQCRLPELVALAKDELAGMARSYLETNQGD